MVKKMKNTLYRVLIIIIGIFTVTILADQKSRLITGTVGKEHLLGKKLVICELGTQSCTLVGFDPDLQVEVNGKMYKPKDFQVGWYVQAEVATDDTQSYVLTSLTVDPGKTIICLSSLNKQQSKSLEEYLLNTEGITVAASYLNFKQVYIEYQPNTISYTQIEDLIVRAGFKIE